MFFITTCATSIDYMLPAKQHHEKNQLPTLNCYYKEFNFPWIVSNMLQHQYNNKVL